MSNSSLKFCSEVLKNVVWHLSLLYFSFGLTISSILDPRISYSGLLADCSDDKSARTHLMLAKNSLKT